VKSSGGSTGSGIAVEGTPPCDGGPDCAVTSPPSDSVVQPPEPAEPPEPVRPDDLPSEEDAKAAALDLLRNAGVDVDGADVHVDDAFTSWSVRVDPMVDGIPTAGLTSYVAVGSKGAIDYANGYLATPERADEYPLTGTAVAIERMNRGEGFGGGVRPLAADDAGPIAGTGGGVATSGSASASPGSIEPAPASDVPKSVDPASPASPASPATPAEPTETVVPGEPIASGEPTPGDPGPIPPDTVEPEPVEPQHVTLTDARQVLLFTPSVDGTEGWLVPAYAFSAGEGEGPVVMAVGEEFLQ
jgi:hypothetical protein